MMKTTKFLFTCIQRLFIFIFTILLSAPILNAQLSGTRTIDKSGGGDYISITEAVDDLNTQGVNGPLTFNIKPGTYDEKVTIRNFPGASESNRVTFQALPADSGDVVLAYTYDYYGDLNETNNTIRFDSANYVSLKRLVFDARKGYFDLYRIIDISGDAGNIEIINNRFIGKSYGTQTGNSLIYSANNMPHDILIENNVFSNGVYYIYMQGKDASNLSPGLTIRGNYFSYPISTSLYLRNQDAPLVENNVIKNSGGNCMTLIDIYNHFIIRNNKMELSGGYGMQVSNALGSFSDWGVIANNFITNHASSASSSGIYLGGNTERIKIYHNSVLISSTSFEDMGVCLSMGSTGSDVDVQNNIFVNMSGGLTFLVSNPAVISNSDYNNYFTTGEYLAKWATTDLSNLQDLVTIGGGDSHSLSLYPGFVSETDLHTSNFLLDNKGNNLSADVGQDIDGESRSTTPDPGADEFTGTGAPLAGDYIIGGVAADFPLLSDAVKELNKFGISAGVNLLVRDDDSPYNEQFTILPVQGADNDSRLTIKPHPSNENPVELTCDYTTDNNNYIFELMGASYLTIKDLNLTWLTTTTKKMIILDGICSYDSIVNCTFTNYYSNSSGQEAIYCSSGDLNGLVIQSNRFIVGSTGIRLEPSEGNTLSGFRIDSNNFSNQKNYGIYLKGCKEFVVAGNYIYKGDAASIYSANIALENCTHSFNVNGNKIYHKGRSGILLKNTVANQANPGIVSNNYIYYHQKYIDGNGVNCQNSQYIGIYHNTILRSLATSNNYTPMYLTGGGNLSIKNNIFCNPDRHGLAMQAEEGLLSDFSNNVLFAAGNSLINYNGKEYRFLEDLESELGTSLNCMEFNPNFPTSGDFHTNTAVLDGAGIPIPGISHDLEGELRSDPPGIGADEFTPAEGPIPAGTYTVGGVSPDFVSFTSLFNDLKIRGISGPVVFRVRKDVYPERPSPVFSIPGSDSNNTVTIESESGVPEDVFLYNNQSSSYPALLALNCVSHLTIKGIYFSNTSNSGHCVSVIGRIKNLRFINCIFSLSTSGNNVQVDANSYDLLFQENEFRSGEIGLNVEGWSQKPAEHTRIINNSFTGSNKWFSIQLNNQAAPQVLGNDILNEERVSFGGIYIKNCYDGLLVNGNKINSRKYGYGISISSCTAALPLRNLVANNQITIEGKSNYASRGIVISNSERAGLYYNSILITSPDTISSGGIHVSTGNTGIDVLNNNISNSGGGYAYLVSQSSAVFLSDFNNYHSTGTNLAKWVSTEAGGLADLQTLSGKETNSLSLDPLFVSETDLQSDELALNEKGSPITEIPYDADSLPRDPVNPDLGAFENTCGPPKFNITVISGCLGDTTVFIDNSTRIDPGSSIGWDWTGDYVPEVYSDGMNDTVKYLFPEPGEHKVYCIVDQVAGCLDSKELLVNIPYPPELSIEIEGVYCDSTNGKATVTVLNGDSPYEYYWSNKSRDPEISGLEISYYTVTVTDSNNCHSTREVYVGEAIQLELNQLGKSTCGKSDGIATVTASGGYPPYRYVWSDGDTTEVDSSMEAGQHFVNVIDSKGCYARGSVTIENDGSGPKISQYYITHPKCYRDKTGAIDISVSGGSSPYKYKWSNRIQTQDIENLAAGIYNVEIEDARNCIGSASFEIRQPLELKIAAAIEDASCAGNDGSAAALVSGGTLPYSYNWSNGDNNPVVKGLSAGIYSVSVTDSNACETIEPVIINNVGGPVVSFTNIKGVGCRTTDNGEINITVSGDGPYTYEWLPNGETTANLSGLSTGTYFIKVTDKNACIGSNQAEITQAPPPVNPICLVTVDSLTQMNKIVWEKADTTDVAFYNIYREGSYRGDYQLIGSRNKDESGIFTDSIADPTIHSWRYKLSVVDVCGNESELSEHHKTMHLTMNLGLDNSVNLIWDEYEGFDVNSYSVFRSDVLVAWQEVASLAGNVSSFTDKDIKEEDLYYYIEVPLSKACIISNYKAATYNYSRSNRKTKFKSDHVSAKSISDPGNSEVSIYPNPGTGVFYLSFQKDQSGSVLIRIMDVSGKMLSLSEINNPLKEAGYIIDLSGYQDGIYQISVISVSGLYHRMIIKE